MDDFEKYLRIKESAGPAALPQSVEQFLEYYPDVPQDFITLHRLHDELSCFLGERYFILWPLDEIRKANEDYNLGSQLLLFASNGGKGLMLTI